MVLRAGRSLWYWSRIRGCGDQRFVIHRAAGVGVVHLAGTAAAAMAVAVGGNGGSVYSADGVGRVHDSYREADAGADLWIVSGIFPRHRGSLWRLGHAGCGGQSEAGEVGTGFGLRASGFRLQAFGFLAFGSWLSAPGFWLQGNCRSSKFAGAVAGTPEARS